MQWESRLTLKRATQALRSASEHSLLTGSAELESGNLLSGIEHLVYDRRDSVRDFAKGLTELSLSERRCEWDWSEKS